MAHASQPYVYEKAILKSGLPKRKLISHSYPTLCLGLVKRARVIRNLGHRKTPTAYAIFPGQQVPLWQLSVKVKILESMLGERSKIQENSTKKKT